MLLIFTMGDFSFLFSSKVQAQVSDVPENHLRIHYQRTDNNYTNLGVWVWDDVKNPSTNWPTGGHTF